MQDDAARPGQTLNGWKEIAAYLGKSVRSVQRWETSLGLPVRRIRTPDGQIIYADKTEIEDWRRYLDGPPMPEPEDPADPESLPESPTSAAIPDAGAAPRFPGIRPAWMLAVAAAIFAAGMLAGWRLARPSPIAVSLAFSGRSLQGLNQQGAVVWSHQFEQDVSQAVMSRDGNGPPPLLSDLDGDGVPEWLVAVRFATHGVTASTSDAVYSVTQDGKVRWSFRPQQALTFPNRTVNAPWWITDYAVSRSAAGRIWVSFQHHTGGSSFIVEITPSGTPTLRYVNFGTIYSVAYWPTPAGGFLAAGGVNLEHKRSVVVLLPETEPPATSPAADRATCAECPAGQPYRMFLFPPTELSIAARELYPYVRNLQVVGPNLKITASQGQGYSQFVLNSDLSLASFLFTQQYWAAHKLLELKKEIDHAAEECPDRFKEEVVREWRRDQGWHEWSVRAALPTD